MSFLKVLNDGLQQWNIDMTEEQIQQFVTFNTIVMDVNEHMNLTAIEDGEPSARRHFLDSLNPHVMQTIQHAQKVIDVGSGAGFPGIPLAIANPNIQFTLLDARKKRTEFMQSAIEQLSLQNVEVVWGRAEDIARKEEYREQYDIACARAVAQIPVLVEYLMPFIQVGGELALYKSATPEEEIASAAHAVSELGGDSLLVRTYTIFGESTHYSIVTGKKIMVSPMKYPRKSGLPTKRPL